MSEKKNIDKLFKEQLKNFEVAPKDAVWEHIEAELHDKKRKKRRVVPIWWKLAGVAAVLLLLFTFGNTVLNKSIENPIVDDVVDTNNQDYESPIETDEIKNPSEFNSTDKLKNKPVVEQNDSTEQTDYNIQDQLTTSDKSQKRNSVVSSSTDNTQIINNNKKLKNPLVDQSKSELKNSVVNSDNKLPKNKKDKTAASTSTQKNAVAVTSNKAEANQEKLNGLTKSPSEINKLIKESQISNDRNITTTIPSEKDQATSAIDTTQSDALLKEENTIENAIAEAEKEKDSTNESITPLKRWSIAPNVAPVYFNSIGKGSSLDQQFVDNTKEGDVNMSYGVKGSYAINKKLKIRAGVNKVDLGYSTNNVLVFDGTSSPGSRLQMQNVQFQDSLNTNSYVSADNFSFTTGPEILFTKEQGSINQQLGFIEVPIEIEYNLIDHKFGLNLIGGFSTLFLSNNEVYSVQRNGDRALLGEATNINDMSYSANFGIGVNYNISKQLRFNLEPTFKYQINTFNDTSGDFQPYFIGVYTGLSFKF